MKNNKYLEKISSSIDEHVNRLDDESKQILDRVNAKHQIISKGDPLYREVLNSGGYRFTYDITRDGDGFKRTYNSYEIRPTLGVRLKSPLFRLLESKEGQKLVAALSRNHEAIELDEFDRHIAPRIEEDAAAGRPISTNLFELRDSSGKLNSQHTNLAVILRESNTARQLPPEYTKKLFSHRNKYEDKIIHQLTGKHYGDEFTEEDFEKARK